jgi:hypothetical protein
MGGRHDCSPWNWPSTRLWRNEDRHGLTGPATFSTDGGKTWIAPDPKQGFLVDADAYGYGADVVLPDGSVYVAYQHTAIVTVQQVKDSGMLAIRLRVRPDHSANDLLPPVPER